MDESRTADVQELVAPMATMSDADRLAYSAFIRFCVERLNRGDSVQAIWHDYQATIEKK